MHSCFNGFCEAEWVAIGPSHDREPFEFVLGEGREDLRHGSTLEAVLPDIFDHTDYVFPVRVIGKIREMLSNRILCAEKVMNQCLVDNHNGDGTCRIAEIKISPTQHRNLECLKVAG